MGYQLFCYFVQKCYMKRTVMQILFLHLYYICHTEQSLLGRIVQSD